MSSIRRALDRLYLASGIASALCLLAIVSLILLQVASRAFGFPFRGGSDYSGYAMAAASFFGFAYALQHGAHIRVSLLLTALGRLRFWGEVWCYALGTALTSYFAWQAVVFTHQTWRFKDVSSGLDATPLWIPQMSMAIGSVIFAIAFWDNLVTLLATGEARVKGEEMDGPPVAATVPIEGAPLEKAAIATGSGTDPRTPPRSDGSR